MIASSGEAKVSCLIVTKTEFPRSEMMGSFKPSECMASKAVFRPSPTSLLGASLNLFSIRTIAPFLAARSVRMFAGVMCAGSRPGLCLLSQLHNCGATWVKTVPVHEVFQGKTVWQGDVEVFDLYGHPKPNVLTHGDIWTAITTSARDSLPCWKSRRSNQPRLRCGFKL